MRKAETAQKGGSGQWTGWGHDRSVQRAPSRPANPSTAATAEPARRASPRTTPQRLACILILSGVFGPLGAVRADSSAVEPEASPHDALLIACHHSLPCRTHLETAAQLFKQSRFDAAVDEYQAAYVLQPYPLILYNIARIYHKQSRAADAVAYYQRYLDTGHSERAERARELLSQAQQEQRTLQEPKAQQEQRTPQEPKTPQELGGPGDKDPAADQRAELPKKPPKPVSLMPLSTPASLAGSAAPSVQLPIYKRWWFWTLLGGAFLGSVAGLSLGIYAAGPPVAGLAQGTLTFGN